MLRNLFDKNGPGLVGLVVSYLVLAGFMWTIFYLFGLYVRPS